MTASSNDAVAEPAMPVLDAMASDRHGPFYGHPTAGGSIILKEIGVAYGSNIEARLECCLARQVQLCSYTSARPE